MLFMYVLVYKLEGELTKHWMSIHVVIKLYSLKIYISCFLNKVRNVLKYNVKNKRQTDIG
jgi:hypothetical protein